MNSAFSASLVGVIHTTMRHDAPAACAQELIFYWILSVVVGVSEEITVDRTDSRGDRSQRRNRSGRGLPRRPTFSPLDPIRYRSGRGIGAGRTRVSRPSLRVQEARTPGDVDAEPNESLQVAQRKRLRRESETVGRSSVSEHVTFRKDELSAGGAVHGTVSPLRP